MQTQTDSEVRGITDEEIAKEVASSLVSRNTSQADFDALHDLINRGQIFEGQQNYEALTKAFCEALKDVRPDLTYPVWKAATKN